MRVLPWSICLAAACGGGPVPGSNGVPAPVSSAPSAAPAPSASPAPRGPAAHEAIASITRVESAPRRASTGTGLASPPERGCTFGEARALLTTGGHADLVGLVEGFAVAAVTHTDTGDALTVQVLSADGTPVRVVGSVPFATPLPANRSAVPALARLPGDRLAVAFVDGASDLYLVTAGPNADALGTPLRVAEGAADGRFPPAVGSVGDHVLVAFTRPGSTQKVEAVVVDAGAVTARYDLTPVSAGAASPVFVESASRTMLTLVDPRAALSMAHAVVFDDDGRPSEPDSLQPIVALAAPARLVSAIGPHDLSLLFLALGSTNAEGVYLLDAHAPSIAPRAVVPPGGNGRIWVDALGAPYGATVVATTFPVDAPAGTNSLVAFTLDGEGASTLTFRAVEGAKAKHPALARDDAGRELVVYGTDTAISTIPIACAGHPAAPAETSAPSGR